MPIYEYVCAACGQRIEVIHSVHAAGPATCEACGGAMRKALSAPAIHFKGSGWAKKDATSSKKPAASSPEKKDDAPAAAAVDAPTPAAPTPASPPATSAAPAPTTTASTGGSGS